MSQTTELTSFPTRSGGAARALLQQILGWPVRVHRARQTMSALGRLGDHELRDIGLTRFDLADVSALPLDTDPSSALRRRADERRRRR